MAGVQERAEGISRKSPHRCDEACISTENWFSNFQFVVLLRRHRVHLFLPLRTRLQDICGHVERSARRSNCIQEHEFVAHIELASRDLTLRSGLELDSTLGDVLIFLEDGGLKWELLVAVVRSRTPTAGGTSHAQPQPIGGAIHASNYYGTPQAPSTTLGGHNPPTPIAVDPKPLQDRAETAPPPERTLKDPAERPSLPKRKLQSFAESPSPPSTESGDFRLPRNSYGRVATKVTPCKQSSDQVSDNPRRRHETRQSRGTSSAEISNTPLLSEPMASATTTKKVGVHRHDMAHLDPCPPIMAPQVSGSPRSRNETRRSRRMSSAEMSDTPLLSEGRASPTTTKKVGVHRSSKAPLDPCPPVMALRATTTKVGLHRPDGAPLDSSTPVMAPLATTTKVGLHQPDLTPLAMGTVKEEDADASARTHLHSEFENVSRKHHVKLLGSDFHANHNESAVPPTIQKPSTQNHDSPVYSDWGPSSAGEIPESPENSESMAYPVGGIPNSPENSESLLSPVAKTANSPVKFEPLLNAYPPRVIPNSPVEPELLPNSVGDTAKSGVAAKVGGQRRRVWQSLRARNAAAEYLKRRSQIKALNRRS